MVMLASEADIHLAAAGGNQRIVPAAGRVGHILQKRRISVREQSITRFEVHFSEHLATMLHRKIFDLSIECDTPEIDDLCALVVDDANSVTFLETGKPTLLGWHCEFCRLLIRVDHRPVAILPDLI